MKELMKVWFTSDQHFDHANILKYCDRPFRSVHEMNEALIANHNSLVKAGDCVYHLGDFAFRNHKNFLSRLNGNHYLIKGNHEGNGWKDAGFIWVRDVAKVKVGDNTVICNHFAQRVWDRAHYGTFHVYGHSHSGLEDLGRSCDVGVDNWNYYPVSYEQLVERFKDVPVLKHH